MGLDYQAIDEKSLEIQAEEENYEVDKRIKKIIDYINNGVDIKNLKEFVDIDWILREFIKVVKKTRKDNVRVDALKAIAEILGYKKSSPRGFDPINLDLEEDIYKK